jgi:uncharacterized membrane protein YoaK (UPF0700 family)
LNSLISISSFFIGSLVFSRLTHRGPSQHLTLSFSFLAQTLAILLSTLLIQTSVIGQESDSLASHYYLQLVPLCLLSFQAGGQMAASRGVGFNELPTTVLTSLYYDISSDLKLLAAPKDNVKRNRRIAAVVSLVLGAIVGGWCRKATGTMVVALWIATGLKLAITLGWLLWRAEPDLP